MKSHSKKVILFVMLMVFGFIFTGTAAWAAVQCNNVADGTASLESTASGKVFCADYGKLNDTYFTHGLCMSGVCYQYFNMVCNDGTVGEYESVVGVLDCGGGGGGGDSDCILGPMGCDPKCFECHQAQ